MKDQLISWCQSNHLSIEELDHEALYLFLINGKEFILINPKEEEQEDESIRLKLFDQEMKFILSYPELEAIRNYKQEKEELYYCFFFGDIFYYIPYTDPENKVVNPSQLRSIGLFKSEFDHIPFFHLGIRGEYEIMNGGQSYDKWTKKAKFYNHTALGICEKNTLAGTLPFQFECKASKIKCILGETISVRNDETNYEVKVYAKNKIGWQNILRINKIINVDNYQDKHISEEQLLQHLHGIICVFSLHSPLSKYRSFIKGLDNEEDLYYQFDTSEYTSKSLDLTILNNHKNYLDNFIDKIKPVLIADSFYIEKDWAYLKLKLNTISKNRGIDNNNQFYKTKDHHYYEMKPLFNEKEDGYFEDFFEYICYNTNEIVEKCNFNVDTTTLKLPKYKYKVKGKTGQKLFDYYIEKGIEEKLGHLTDEQMDLYLERIAIEYEVIEDGGLFDYFTALVDINNYADKQGILRGFGRGSAASSLIGYLFDITRVDPVEFNLPFARFLNRARIGKKTLRECFKITGSKGEEIYLYPNDLIKVVRNKQKIEIFVKDLEENDIIYDSESLFVL